MPTVHPQHDGGKSDRSIRAAIDLRIRNARRQIEGVDKDVVDAEVTIGSAAMRGI